MSDCSYEDDAVEVRGEEDENQNVMLVKRDELEVASETVETEPVEKEGEKEDDETELVDKDENEEGDKEEESENDETEEVYKEEDEEPKEKEEKVEKRGRKKIDYPGWIEIPGGKMQCVQCEGVKGPVDRKNIGQHNRVYHLAPKFTCEICSKV